MPISGKMQGQSWKQPNSCLKYPFVDPGSVYDGNLWDWDSFWAVYALFSLVNSSGDQELRDLVVNHAKGNIQSFSITSWRTGISR